MHYLSDVDYFVFNVLDYYYLADVNPLLLEVYITEVDKDHFANNQCMILGFGDACVHIN